MKAKTQNTLASKILDIVYVSGFLTLFTFTVMQIINS